MSVINVSLEDTFEQWRVKTNLLGTTIGDVSLLDTTATSSLVDALNEVRSTNVVDGLLNIGGTSFIINVDSADSAEFVLTDTGNLTLSGKLFADVQGDLTGNAATASKLKIGRIIDIIGDATLSTTFDGSQNVEAILTLASTGVTAGTFTKFTVDVKGRITNATAIASSDITTALGYTPVSTSTGYLDPTWITSLDGGKLLSTSSVLVQNVTVANRLFVANGSATAPSIAFTSDTNTDTGLYWSTQGYTYFTNNGVKSGEIQPGGNLLMVGNVGAYSDIRLKKDIETIKGALDIVNNLRGIFYTSIDSNERSVGVVAQEVKAEIPELTRENPETGMLSVSYGNMGGLLLQAINELTDRVKAIEEKLG